MYNTHNNSHSMSRDRSAKERERLRQQAREMRESQAASGTPFQDREQPVVFDVVRRSPNAEVKNNYVEKVLGSYDVFAKVPNDKRKDMVGVDQQPPTPAPARQPIHNADTYATPLPQPSGPGPGGSSKSSLLSQVSLPPPPPQSSHNGTTRPPKISPQPCKPPHPPSHHSHGKNGEVKGNLKSGPGPGPGDGGGGSGRSSSSSASKPGLPPLKVGAAVDISGKTTTVDPTIQQIMSEMSLKPPMSAILTTPRHSQDANFLFPITPLKDTPVKDNKDGKSSRRSTDLPPRLGKASDMSRNKQPKPLEGGNVKDDLGLSEDSEDEDERTTVSDNRGTSAAAQGGTPTSHLQSNMVSTTTKPPLSPISPKTSEDSSTSDDTSDDSDASSNNTSDDEQQESPPASPKAQENKSPKGWTLINFITPRMTGSPKVHGSVATGAASGPRSDEAPQLEATSHAPPSRGRHNRRASKVTSTSSSSRRPPHSIPERTKSEAGAQFEDSSDEEPQSRPTPRVSARLPPTVKHSRESDHKPKPRQRIASGPNLSSDSDSDRGSFTSWKSGSNQSLNGSNAASKSVPKVSEKSPKTVVAPPARETLRKTPKKKSESTKKDSQLGAKSEAGKSKRGKLSREYLTTDNDSDSDSDRMIDVVSSTPEKGPSRATPTSQCTPTRTPKDLPKAAPSPLKSVQSSPHKSPMTANAINNNNNNNNNNKNSVKKSCHGRLSEAQITETSVGKSEDERLSPANRDSNTSHRRDAVKDKGDREFCIPEKVGREKDPVEAKNRKIRNRESRKTSSGNKNNRSDKTKRDRSRSKSETTPIENRVEVRPGASPLASKVCESPVVSAEPKVPIPQLYYEHGVPILTCTIPLSFINKVPKLSVNNMLSTSKTLIKEEVVDKKEVLDNRTKGGKGKRKTCDPNTKSSCNEDVSKLRIITSIFGVKRQDHESEQEKIKKEVKTEPVESEDEKIDIKPSITVKEEPEETGMARPSSVRQRNVSASPMSSIASDSSSSKQHRKKKKDRQPEKSPSSRGSRKRQRGNSEHLSPNYPSVTLAAGSNSCDGCDLVRSQRDPSVESERSTSTRKRELDPDSSLERSKKPKLSKSKENLDAPTNSPSVRHGSQRTVDDGQGWTQDKEELHPNKYPQRSQHSQQSSQYSQKGYSGVSEDAGVNEELEFGDEGDSTTRETRSTHQGYYGKDKAENSVTTPRPVSEHESRSGSGSYKSGLEQAESTECELEDSSAAGSQISIGTVMVPPLTQRQSASTTGSATTSSSLAPARPIADQPVLHGPYANPQERPYTSYFARRSPEINKDYMMYLNMAKELKHTADEETDRSMQAMKYLESGLYFILSGKSMEIYHDTSSSLTMYKDTLNFIKWVSSVFRKNQAGSINTKLAIISLRCQSLLSLKIYRMRRNEHKETQRQLNKYFQSFTKHGNVDASGNSTTGGAAWGQRASGSPSHLSQTPSPAGSVGSEGSQSSGYTTSNESRTVVGGGCPPVGHTPPHPQPPQGANATIPVPLNIHSLIMKQNQLSGQLATAHDMWIEADNYVFQNGMQNFFIELDREVSPLTLHSSLCELVYYVQQGLQRLMA